MVVVGGCCLGQPLSCPCTLCSQRFFYSGLRLSWGGVGVIGSPRLAWPQALLGPNSFLRKGFHRTLREEPLEQCALRSFRNPFPRLYETEFRIQDAMELHRMAFPDRPQPLLVDDEATWSFLAPNLSHGKRNDSLGRFGSLIWG